MIALSCNEVETHNEWIKDIKAYGKLEAESKFPYPIIDDKTRHLSHLLGKFRLYYALNWIFNFFGNYLGMLDPDETDSAGMPLSARSVTI